MTTNIEYTDEFGWWSNLSDSEQNDIVSVVTLLEKRGIKLGYLYSSKIKNSKHLQMCELGIQSKGKPIRVFYAFDTKRDAVLLIGGDKTGDKRFYIRMIPIADSLYDTYLEEIKEGLI